jgi:hypothetical protein
MIANTPDHIIYYDKFQRDKKKTCNKNIFMELVEFKYF